MNLYLVIGEYGIYSDTCMIVERVCTDISVAVDYLISFRLGDISLLEEKIKKCCIFKEPSYEINCSLEEHHLKESIKNIFFRKERGGGDNAEHYIEEKVLTTEFNVNNSNFICKPKYVYNRENQFYQLYYNYTLKEFDVKIFRYDESSSSNTENKVITSPLLEKLNEWFKKYFEDSLNIISKR